MLMQAALKIWFPDFNENGVLVPENIKPSACALLQTFGIVWLNLVS